MENRPAPVDSSSLPLPLLEEFSQLLEKEKMLLELQYMEKIQDADSWRDKYSRLVDRLSIAAVKENTVASAIIADSTSTPDVRPIQSLLMELNERDNMIKISTRDLTVDAIKRIQKYLKEHGNIKQFVATHCNVLSVDGLAQLCSISSILAIDLSANSLVSPFEADLVRSMQVRAVRVQLAMLLLQLYMMRMKMMLKT